MDKFPMMSTTKQHLFMILFFTGIVLCVLSETRMYFLVQQKKSWTDARIYCRAEDTDLAIIKSNSDTIQLQKAAQGLIFFFSAWIGLYSDINSWRWSLNNKPVGGMRLWDGREPNNKYGDQNCGSISHWGWWDQACDLLYPFMCFDETKTGSDRYIYINNTKQWHEAQAYCRHYHTDLASARDESENSVILGKITGVTWFGLIKDPWRNCKTANPKDKDPIRSGFT